MQVQKFEGNGQRAETFDSNFDAAKNSAADWGKGAKKWATKKDL